MISTNEFYNGAKMEVDGKIYSIVEFQHVKPGKGGAFVRVKLKDFKTGAVLDKTYRSGEKFVKITIENKPVQYLYCGGENYCFMDGKTYEQYEVNEDIIGDAKFYLVENTEVILQFKENEILGIEMPVSVNLKVAECPPAVKGDTVSGATKEVTLETGLKAHVPLFITPDDTLKIDTRTGQYLSRA